MVTSTLNGVAEARDVAENLGVDQACVVLVKMILEK